MNPSNMALAAQASHDLSFLLQCQYALHVHHPEECLNRWAIDDLESKFSDLAALLGYEIVKPEDVAALDDSWIEWNGGECPVGPDVNICATARGGWLLYGRAGDFRWHHLTGGGDGGDIIDYRIVKGGAA